MKKALSIALSLLLALSLAACGNSDADKGDTTKDGVIGDGLGGDLGDDMRDLGDDIRGVGDDILGTGDENSARNRSAGTNDPARHDTGVRPYSGSTNSGALDTN